MPREPASKRLAPIAETSASPEAKAIRAERSGLTPIAPGIPCRHDGGDFTGTGRVPAKPRRGVPRLRRWFDRVEWTIRLLRLSRAEEASTQPGLVLVQIDGLSQREFHQAVKSQGLPFLSRLCAREQYVVHPHYSGLPSNTPGVQAELFYGVRGAVPAFSFLDHQTQRVVRMFAPGSAELIEQRLQAQGAPLLEGGSAYADIFSGGASEAHFCAAKLGWDGLLRAVNPVVFPFLILLHLDVWLWVAALVLTELALAAGACLQGVLRGSELYKELEFILARLGPVILLRELVVRGAQIDMARGLPIIHVNLIGYDDHAHRRGPRSSFARWPLKGIDSAVAHLWRAAQQSRRRAYDVWIYSDHGQEVTTPYPEIAGMTLAEAVKRFCDRIVSTDAPEEFRTYGFPYWTVPMTRPVAVPLEPVSGERQEVIVTAMGPIGHIYPPSAYGPEDVERLAKGLVSTGVPLVAVPGAAPDVRVWTADGVFHLPQDAARIIGERHPFLADVTDDLVALCRHRSAGALVLFGWRDGVQPMTFPVEHGAHAGFGLEETHGFALLPVDAPLPARDRAYLRPGDLREAVQRHLGRSVGEREPPPARPRARRALRVMTYNVHRCIGLDHRASPERIARVIARHEPDLIALQELDVGQRRTHGVDQAARIAELLRMSYHFHPVIALARGQYGNAILSRFPMRLVRAERLPQLGSLRYLEPRGAMWVAVDVDGLPVQVVNCHLSIWPYERLLQARMLLSDRWTKDPLCQPPVVLCGDFNATPGSPSYCRFQQALRDIQTSLPSMPVPQTWFSRYPVSRLDHIFTSPDITVRQIVVPRTELDQAASDHLPLVAELALPG